MAPPQTEDRVSPFCSFVHQPFIHGRVWIVERVKPEVHGMAQQGGSVATYVRWGEKVCSPLIGPGEAGFFLAFERLEAMRERAPPKSVELNQQAFLVGREAMESISTNDQRTR